MAPPPGCNNTSAFGSGAAPAAGATVTLTTCAYAGEYSTITSVEASTQYISTSTGGAGNYITIRQGTPGGTVIAAGPSPLTWTSTVAGTYYQHINTNSSCGTDATCHTSSIQRPLAGCNNTTAYLTVTAPAAGATVTVSTCIFAGEYNTINSVAAATQYISTSTGGTGNFITIRQGTPGGAIIAAGTSPLTWTSTVAGTYYEHINTNSSCGTDATCHTTTIQRPLAGCNNASAYGTAVLPSGGGSATIGCNFAGEYGIWTGGVAGVVFTTTSTVTSDFITVREGTPGGPIVAAGTQPVVWTAPVTGTYYIHVNTNSSCGTVSSCRDITTSGPALPPPANDACSGATTLACGASLSGTTVNTVLETSPAGCASQYGVWYTFTGDGQATTITSTASFDHELTILSGSCGSLTSIACVDLSLSTETYSFTTVPGVQYYVYVAHWSTSSTITGTFTIDRTCTPPPPDPCASIGTLSCGSTQTANITAGVGVWSLGPWTTPGREALYTFTPTQTGQYSITVNNFTGGYFVDLFFKAVSSGCNATGWNYVIDFGGTGQSPTFTLTAGVAYYILFDDEDINASSLNFTLNCPPPPPANDEIAGAIPVTCGSTTNGTSVNATQGIDELGTCVTSSQPGVWYSLTGTGNPITISTCGGAAWDTKLSVFTGTSGSLTCVTGNDDACGLQSSVNFTSISGTTYWILVHGFGGATGTFALNVTCAPSTWVGGVSADWHTGGNWTSGSVPLAGTDVVIPNVTPNFFPLISTPVTVNDLTINTGATVSVAPGAGLTLDGTMTNNGIFTLQSDASGTGWLDDFTLVGTVVGNIRVQRYVPIGVAGFRQLGTPVTLNSISSVMNFTPVGNPGFVIPLSDCNPNWVAFNSPYGNWMQLVENGPVQFNCYQSLYQVLTSGNMTRGRGYYMDVPGGTTLTFVGAPNTGPISDFTATHANGAVTNGWNIVSNPYPSPLRWSTADVPAGFDAIAQVWVTSGTYLGTFQPVDPSTPGQGIAIGQAFQLRVSTPGSSVPFSVSNANRTTAPPSFLFSGNDPMTLNIDMNKGSHADLTKIRFVGDATPAYDGMFDSYKVLGNANQPMVYSILNSENMSINSYGALTDVYSVRLGIKAGTAGEHTFVFSNMDQFPASTLIYLEDAETGIWQNMRANDTYSFNAPQGTHNGRFIVHFYPPVDVNTTEANCTETGTIEVVEHTPAEWNYSLSDVQNNIISSGALNGTVTVSDLAIGTYELTLTEVVSGYSSVESVTINGSAGVVAQAAASLTTVEVGQPVQFSSNAQNADVFKWNFSDGILSDESNPVHMFASPGTYKVVLNAINSSTSCSAESVVMINVTEASTSSVEEMDAEDVKMWNVENTVFISFGSEWAGKTTFTLYDAAGKRVMNKQLNNAQGTVTVDCGVLAAGTYTAELSNGKKVVTHKAVMGIK
ncbi:MAG: PKD domain-containing protein [Flavobacteriales bacterium]|nr:PKD domain-containing protein [Flavobacteriales bacterium]